VTITSGGAPTPPAAATSGAHVVEPLSSDFPEPDERGISVAVAPSTVAPRIAPADDLEAEPAVPSPRPEASSHDSGEGVVVNVATAPPIAYRRSAPDDRSAGERLRAALPVTGPGLTGPGGVLLGSLIVGLGAIVDLAVGGSLGLGFTVTFVLACAVVAMAMRIRALATAVVLPPLLFAGAALMETKQSGVTSGNRQAALDVATSLALSAPALFLGTALALAVVLARLIARAVRR
jgi:hypothetical protein